MPGDYPSIESGARAAWLVTSQAGRDSRNLRPDGDALGTGTDHSLSLLSRATVQSFRQEYQGVRSAGTGEYRCGSRPARCQKRSIFHLSASSLSIWSYAACGRDSESARSWHAVAAGERAAPGGKRKRFCAHSPQRPAGRGQNNTCAGARH